MKRIISIVLCAVALVGFASFSALAEDAFSEKWNDQKGFTNAHYSASKSESCENYSKIIVGKDYFAFIRMPLKGTWLASELKSARLFLKLIDGKAPKNIRISAAAGREWSYVMSVSDAAKACVKEADLKTVPVRAEADDWVSIDVTEYVKLWLNCDIQNYGFGFFGADGEAEAVFATDSGEENFPYLEVSGEVGERDLSYGKFGFTRWPLENPESREGGNCLAYALRDTVLILPEDLGIDWSAMDGAYKSGGEDSVADYIGALLERYVKDNQEGLAISKFRKIDDFDSPIDPKTEYRMALRVGCNIFPDETLSKESEFDYHFWAQLNDGKWTQKFQLDYSEIVACSAPGISPCKFAWDGDNQWLEKNQGFDKSKPIYYAVTKDTDKFTAHKKYEEDQPRTPENQQEKFTLQGDANGNLRPDDIITRAEAAKIMCHFLQNDYEAKNFTDVDKNTWYYEYVNKAVDAGIMRGTSETTFDPNGAMTCEMAALVFWRQLSGAEADKSQLPSSYTDAGISVAAAATILVLSESGAANVTRAGFITLLNGAYER